MAFIDGPDDLVCLHNSTVDDSDLRRLRPTGSSVVKRCFPTTRYAKDTRSPGTRGKCLRRNAPDAESIAWDYPDTAWSDELLGRLALLVVQRVPAVKTSATSTDLDKEWPRRSSVTVTLKDGDSFALPLVNRFPAFDDLVVAGFASTLVYR